MGGGGEGGSGEKMRKKADEKKQIKGHRSDAVSPEFKYIPHSPKTRRKRQQIKIERQ